MKQIDIDKVPRNLTEAVQMIVDALETKDIKTLQKNKDIVAAIHHNFGQYIRNSWSLWDGNTHLCAWFRNCLDIGHADDISSIIVEAVQAKVNDQIYDPTLTIKRFHDHWQKFGCDHYGEPIKK